MRTAVALCLLAAVQMTSSKGTGLPTRTYARPSSPSNAYKYAGAGLVGGLLIGYWAGGVRYSPSYSGYQYDNYDGYRNYHSNNDAAWRSRYGQGASGYRQTNCQRSETLPRPELTEGWVWVQAAIGISQVDFKSVEFEVDLFRDLVWRSPCNLPTQIIVSRVCKKAARTALTEAEMANPAICTYQGGTDSVHSAARRSLLQTTQWTIVEFAVGVRSDEDHKMQDMLLAIKESLADHNGQIYSIYQISTVEAQAGNQKGSAFVASEFQEDGSAVAPRVAGAAAVAAAVLAFVQG
eukprot:TRINITY_DN60964_c0_g1_i1.p2 TRINITY_DN60964_c0_g1~~TRINITY_DN60964_c0_g1_i1.p2  ORF type:complete len:293 (+),score=81.93 TRINITY_DN60964_c0_g1_i1:102-980(+)